MTQISIKREASMQPEGLVRGNIELFIVCYSAVNGN